MIVKPLVLALHLLTASPSVRAELRLQGCSSTIQMQGPGLNFLKIVLDWDSGRLSTDELIEVLNALSPGLGDLFIVECQGRKV